MASSSRSLGWLQRTSLLLLALPCLLARPGWALKLTRFNVPAMVERGSDVTLTCEFDLEGERLYSVKWYKANREFYRYVPVDRPPKQDFMQKGVAVDTERSDHQRVTLKGLNADSGGKYRCEVLTESPHFKTLLKSGNLTVFERPEGSPVVVGGQHQYRSGETVNLTCLAPKSIPPVNLTWFINDKKAEPHLLIAYAPKQDSDGRSSSRLGLLFKAQQWYFPQGRASLRCRAAISRGGRPDKGHIYQAEAEHESVVVPPDPLSLGHDASDAFCVFVETFWLAVLLVPALMPVGLPLFWQGW